MQSASFQAPATLLSGQSLLLEVPAGAALHLLSGQLRITGRPLWLGARLVPQVHELRAGAVHVVDEGGWLLLDGIAASSLRWRLPEPQPGTGQRVRELLVAGWALARGIVQRHADAAS